MAACASIGADVSLAATTTTCYTENDSSKSQVSIYGARGILIESQSASWFYGTGSEHAVLYQYQLYKAET